MSEVRYVGGKHMTLCKCVTSFKRNAAILLSEHDKNARETTVFNKLCVWNGY